MPALSDKTYEETRTEILARLKELGRHWSDFMAFWKPSPYVKEHLEHSYSHDGTDGLLSVDTLAAIRLNLNAFEKAASKIPVREKCEVGAFLLMSNIDMKKLASSIRIKADILQDLATGGTPVLTEDQQDRLQRALTHPDKYQNVVNRRGYCPRTFTLDSAIKAMVEYLERSQGKAPCYQFRKDMHDQGMSGGTYTRALNKLTSTDSILVTGLAYRRDSYYALPEDYKLPKQPTTPVAKYTAPTAEDPEKSRDMNLSIVDLDETSADNALISACTILLQEYKEKRDKQILVKTCRILVLMLKDTDR